MNRRLPPLPANRATAALCVAIVISASASSDVLPEAAPGDNTIEDIYVLRSIREDEPSPGDRCNASRTGFAPFEADAERFFTFWSIATLPADGRITDAKHAPVATLRACFGPTDSRVRQNFYAEVQMQALTFNGAGECVALLTDFPEPGLFPVHCHLVLGGIPEPFVGGILTTNTLTSKAAFGGDTEPSGYTQASIATIRLWRNRPTR